MLIMTKTVITQITDDLDGSNGAETVTFGYRGTDYEIDLGRRNSSAFDKAIKPYVDAARKVTLRGSSRRGSSSGRNGRGRSRSAADLTAIRTWAREQGYTVADRGRISAEITDAYSAAH